MKIRNLLLTGVVLTALSSPVWASKMSQHFIQEATIGNQFEISSSRLALQNSQDGDVKQFAQQMVDDHTKIGNQLKSVIASSGAELSEPSASMDSKHQALLDRLNALKGEAFDKEYVKDQVRAHDDAIALFEHYAKSEDNDALKNFVKEQLPTLNQHKQYVNKLKTAL